MMLHDKLPAATRDAIFTEAAAFSTMLEGDECGAALGKAAKLRSASSDVIEQTGSPSPDTNI